MPSCLTIFGIAALPEHGITSIAAFKAAVKEGQLNMLHSADSIRALSPVGGNSGLTWYACFLGYLILGIISLLPFILSRPEFRLRILWHGGRHCKNMGTIDSKSYKHEAAVS